MHKTIEVRYDARRWRVFMMIEWPAVKERNTRAQRVISLRRGEVGVGTVAEFLKTFGPVELARTFRRDQTIQDIKVDAYKGLLAAWRKECQAQGLHESQMGVGVD